MFHGRFTLTYLPDISNLLNKIKNTDFMFDWCISLSNIPDKHIYK